MSHRPDLNPSAWQGLSHVEYTLAKALYNALEYTNKNANAYYGGIEALEILKASMRQRKGLGLPKAK